MTQSFLRAQLIAVLLMALMLTGCQRSAELHGTVKYQGQPIADGAITLVPADGKGPTQGTTITQGAYELKDLQPGKKIVQIIGVKEVKWVASSEDMAKQAEEMKLKSSRTDVVFAADQVPEDAVGNNETIEITVGRHQKDFDLQPPTK